MKVFYHHIYEYKKGLRNLILHTAPRNAQHTIEKRLQKEGISYLIDEVNGSKINVFLGDRYCIEVLKSFETISLNKLINEQDFILGIMLGYDRLKQCQRYLTRKNNDKDVSPLVG